MFTKCDSPGEEKRTAYLWEYITAQTSFLVVEVPDRDLVDLRIHNIENVKDKAFAIICDPRTSINLVRCGTFWRKVIQSNAKFGLTDRLEAYLDNVRLPAGNGIIA
jgi:hypothetical protein